VTTHGIELADSRFWVIHRRIRYGPFDYEWAADLRGLELTYCGRKFGEICSPDEIFADMSEFRLPRRVVEVASIVSGSLAYGILHGLPMDSRRLLVRTRLREHGCGQFALR